MRLTPVLRPALYKWDGFRCKIRMVIFTKPESYPHSTFSFFSVIFRLRRGYEMDYENLEKKLIRQQNLYIQQLEGQLAVYKEKDRTQEQLIENLEHALNVLSDELSRLKQEKK